MNDNISQGFRKKFNGIEHRSQIHPCRGYGIVNILDIPEKYIGCRQKHAKSQIKDKFLGQHKWEQDEMPGKNSAGKDNNDQESPHGKNTVNEAAGNL